MRNGKTAAVKSVLRLKGHCIACAVNRRAHELTVQMLNSEETESIEDKNSELELLTRFHLQTDFSRLCTERPELSGGSPVEVTLSEDEFSRFNISVRPLKNEERLLEE